MKIERSHESLRWVIAVGLLGCAVAANAGTGARVVLQVWSPLSPDNQQERVLLDNPTLVSDLLQNQWSQVRQRICEQLRLEMGRGGFANGQTLRDIKCVLDERIALDVKRADQNALQATFSVNGYVEATSTTPTVLGSYADPRFSLALTARFDLVMAVQPDRNATLRVAQAKFTLNNATLDSHNASADAAKFLLDDLVPFFGGPNYKRMAENAVNRVSLDLANQFNPAVAALNAQLVGPSEAVRADVSVRTGYILVTFAPREFVPPTNGRMSGLVRWNPQEFTPRNGCSSFEIGARVQTGPQPVHGEAPTRQLGTLDIRPAGEGACAFTLSGLAAGWPNVLTSGIVGGNASAGGAGSSIYNVHFGLLGDGWNAGQVVPQPFADGRNYRVGRAIDATAVKRPHYKRMDQVVDDRVNPRVNPTDILRQSDRSVDINARVSGDRARHGDAVMLNPQPLPPSGKPQQPRSIQTPPSAADRATEKTGTLIVGGKVGKPALRKAPSAGTAVDPAAIKRVQPGDPTQ